jgi:hypothetical protein
MSASTPISAERTGARTTENSGRLAARREGVDVDP